MIDILQQEEIEDLLKSQLVGRIGCHANGETYIVPISYAYDGTYIYCHTKEGKKINILRSNPKLCFQVDSMKDMANWQSVIVQGEFEELKNGEERKAAMLHLLNRYLPMISSVTTHLGEFWPFPPNETTEIKGIVFRISIREKTGRFESSVESPDMAG